MVTTLMFLQASPVTSLNDADHPYFCATGGLTPAPGSFCHFPAPLHCAVDRPALLMDDFPGAAENCACSSGYRDQNGDCASPPTCTPPTSAAINAPLAVCPVLKALFKFTPQTPATGESITFNASDSLGQIVNYTWDFGDGHSAQGLIVTHAYTKVGQFTVTLTVTDNNGLTGTASLVVPVTCSVPTGEITDEKDYFWGVNENATAYFWKVTLTPTTISFEGQQVTEIFVGSTDTCWFDGSIVPQLNLQHRRSTWNVASDNTLPSGDQVGWLTDHVDFYRRAGRVPCGGTLTQEMVINCPEGSMSHYTTNVLKYGMTSITVTSGRAGRIHMKRW